MEMKELIKRDGGAVQASADMFDQEQKKVLEKIFKVADRNPVLNWRMSIHNTDFIEIEGKIEPVKNFCLKAQYIAGLSVSNTGIDFQGEGINLRTVARVKIWKEGDYRSVEMAGASTIRECIGSKTHPNRRAFHDAIARAQTRAFKSALEAYLGMPFINYAIKMIFGGFEVVGKPEDEGASYGDVG